MGAFTPLGRDWPEAAAALAQGKSAVAQVTTFDVAGFPCRVAAAIPDALPGVEDRRLELARRAAREAFGAARIDAPAERIGVFVGAESGRASFQTVLALAGAAGGGARFDHLKFGVAARALAEQIDASVVSPAAVASALAGEFGARGPAITLSLACASGAWAIAAGARAVRSGACEVALCGGVGADVDPLMLAGFGLLGALSSAGISRPFDARRDGFVVGEGAAFVVLSSERGDAVAEVAGAGRSLDAYRLTDPDPEGDGAARAMRAALAQAGEPRIGYVQAHGTSTPQNDAVEARALHRIFGARLKEAYVASVKGAVGHWVAGAGAIGFLCALEAVVSGTLLPTAGLEEPDPALPLRHVMGKAISADVESALCNSFAFGGANCSLVVSRVR